VAEALIERKDAGVYVEGIFDALGAANAYSQDETLCDAGIPVKVEDFGGVMHHKLAIVDVDGEDPTVVFGSYNWTRSGAETNDENTLIIHDAALAQRYYQEYRKLYDALDPSTASNPVPTPTPTATVTTERLYLPLLMLQPRAPTTTPTATSQPAWTPTVTPSTS